MFLSKGYVTFTQSTYEVSEGMKNIHLKIHVHERFTAPEEELLVPVGKAKNHNKSEKLYGYPKRDPKQYPKYSQIILLRWVKVGTMYLYVGKQSWPNIILSAQPTFALRISCGPCFNVGPTFK